MPLDGPTLPLWWNVRLNAPAPPAGVQVPHGVGNTPEEAVKDLATVVAWERARAAHPVAYYDALLAQLRHAS